MSDRASEPSDAEAFHALLIESYRLQSSSDHAVESPPVDGDAEEFPDSNDHDGSLERPGAETVRDVAPVEPDVDVVSNGNGSENGNGVSADRIPAITDEERPAPFGSDGDRFEEIARVLSHDLRNPLSVARGHLELAKGADPERVDHHLERVDRAHDRIEDLVEDVVGLARSGRHAGEFAPVDLCEAATTAWQMVETCEATLDVEGTIRVVADRSRLGRLLENLFANAITHGGSDVTVSVGCLDGGFYVEDDGQGFTTDHHGRLFEQGYSSTDGHTGLGLSIVRQVADAHGWDVLAKPSDSGGARFEVRGVRTDDERP